MVSVVLALKHCPGCGESLEAAHFSRDASTKDGLGAYCKECRNRRGRLHRAKSQVKAAVKAQKAQYYLDNKDRIKASTTAYAQQHPELYRQAYLAWQRRNPEECVRRSRARRALRLSAPCISYTQEQLVARLSMFPFCYLCGEKPQAVDHVKPLAKGGWDCLSNFRSICHSCNGRKKDKWPFAEAMVLRRWNHRPQIL